MKGLKKRGVKHKAGRMILKNTKAKYLPQFKLVVGKEKDRYAIIIGSRILSGFSYLLSGFTYLAIKIF